MIYPDFIYEYISLHLHLLQAKLIVWTAAHFKT